MRGRHPDTFRQSRVFLLPINSPKSHICSHVSQVQCSTFLTSLAGLDLITAN
jgi:hypothetical protein